MPERPKQKSQKEVQKEVNAEYFEWVIEKIDTELRELTVELLDTMDREEEAAERSPHSQEHRQLSREADVLYDKMRRMQENIASVSEDDEGQRASAALRKKAGELAGAFIDLATLPFLDPPKGFSKEKAQVFLINNGIYPLQYDQSTGKTILQ